MEDLEGLTKDGTVVVIDNTSVTFKEMVAKIRSRPGTVFVIDEAYKLQEEYMKRNLEYQKLHPEKEVSFVIFTDAAQHSKDLELVGLLQEIDLKRVEAFNAKPEVKTVAPYLQKVNRQKRNLRRL